MSQNEDDLRNILVTVIEKLHAEDFRRLRSYVDGRRDDEAGFLPWLTVVTKRTAIDYMRGHDTYLDKRRSNTESGANGAWIISEPLPMDSQLDGGRPPVTNRGTALTLLQHAYAILTEDQMRVLELWILNNSYDSIASQAGLQSAHEANKMVRAALERLRRRFRKE